jgi:N-acetylglutamate synthase-like GNAT family acetyltransferase
MKLAIRAYQISDKQACLEVFESNVPKYFTQAEIADYDKFLEMIPIKVEANKTFYYVVVFENKVIGCGGFGDKDNSDIITLAWGLIHQNFHKKGIGKVLLDYRLDQIKEKFPNQPVYIDTTQYSYGFFEKYGFETIKITNNFYEKGLHRYDMKLVFI